MAAIDQFYSALEFALEKLGKAELSLKRAQYEALKSHCQKSGTKWGPSLRITRNNGARTA